jgi:hypothetical protein
MATRPDSRQVVLRSIQAMLGSAANDSLDTIFPKINDEIAKLFEDRNILLTQGGLITYTGTQVEFTENLNLVINQKISGAVPQIISLGSTTRSFASSGDMLIATVDRTAGTATLSVITSGNPLPAVSSSNQEIFLIAVRYDATDGTQRLYWRTGMAMNAGQTIRLGSSGTGSGGGLGDDLITTQFQASFTDEFEESPTTSASAVNSAITNAEYSAAKGLYKISYDASKTVTGTGTSMTLSGVPSFTIAAGDVLIVAGEARRITAVPTQTTPTIESAFTTNPSAAACTVSQAVHSKDVYNTAFDGSAISSAFATTFSEILVDYEDTSTVGDSIFDINTAPVIAFSASHDGSSWTANSIRPTSPLTQLSTTNLLSAGTALYLRFFANKTSGSGTVNILKYKAYMQKLAAYSSGGVINSALAFTDSVGTPINCSVGLYGGKTAITLTWTYPVGINPTTSNGSLEVYLNGQKIPRYVNATLTPDASYTELSPTVVVLDQNYSALNISVEIVLPAVYVDQSSQNSTNIANIAENILEGTQGFVKNSSILSATTTAGAPATGTFYSSVINRAPIVDITQDLRASFGIERISVPQSYEIPTEFGSNGEIVRGAVNDDRELIRFVGLFEDFNSADGNGVRFRATSTNSYIEITFYGTGLNWLVQYYSGYAGTFVYSVDGGSETSISMASSATVSSVISARNYNANQVVNVVSGLSLGVHTVRIKRTDSSVTLFAFFGFETLNTFSTTSINVNSGISYIGGSKLVSQTNSLLPYNSTFESGTLGIRGGRVLVYQKSNGTIAKAVTPTNAAQANLTLADHTNEEVARVYYPREFGANRADDFSTSTSTSSAQRAFTLEDGTTNLNGANVGIIAFATGSEGVYATNGTSNYYTLTFVGTGLDIRLGNNDANAKAMTVSIDGSASVGTISLAANAAGTTVRVVSGLPYGTHVVKFTNANAGVSSPATVSFTVYQPKKPTLPEGCVELADYNVMATYVANTVAGQDTIGTGVLRKYTAREATYSGTWIYQLSTTPMGGVDVYSSTNGDYMQYHFFGTGFDLRSASGASSTWILTVDGSSNLSAFTTSSYGLTSFTAATGTIITSAVTSIAGTSISGLTLGWHTLRITKSATAANNEWPAIDVITPIHSHKSSLNYDQQNTLPVGSQSISDNRVFTPIKDVGVQKKNISQAFQITSIPTSNASTDVPCPDLSVTHYNTTGRIKISYSSSVGTNSTGSQVVLSIYVNGNKVSLDKGAMSYASGATYTISDSILLNINKGFNKIDIYWRMSGGATGTAYGRNLLVEEID